MQVSRSDVKDPAQNLNTKSMCGNAAVLTCLSRACLAAGHATADKRGQVNQKRVGTRELVDRGHTTVINQFDE